jgi:hypothetical protein
MDRSFARSPKEKPADNCGDAKEFAVLRNAVRQTDRSSRAGSRDERDSFDPSGLSSPSELDSAWAIVRPFDR